MPDPDTDTTIHLAQDFVQDPYALYDRLREEQPVVPVTLPRGLRVWLVTRFADVRAALADQRLRKDHERMRALVRERLPNGTGTMFTSALAAHMLNSDPPDHDRLRNLVNAAFTTRRVRDMRPRIEDIAQALLDHLGPAEKIDLVPSFAFPLPVTVICELLGVPARDRDEFRSWTNTLLSTSGMEDARAASVSMTTYLTDLVATKRADPGPDMLSALVATRDSGDRLTETELISMAFLLLVAGHETTVNLIGNGMLALLRNPGQLAVLRADRSLLPGAIEEFLRYEGPVNLASLRHTSEPVELSGVRIPADEFVVVSLASANHDQRRYDDPDRLDLRRDTAGHLAFGHGVHYCLGAPLARLEAEVAFGALLDRYQHIELAVPPENLRWRLSAVLRGLTELPLIVR